MWGQEIKQAMSGYQRSSDTVGVMIQKRIAFGLEDLFSIRMVCQECGHEAVWRASMPDTDLMPTKCPFCNSKWARTDLDLLAIINDLRKYISASGGAKRVKVGFEINVDA